VWCMHVYACVRSSMFARMGTGMCVSTYPLKENMHVCVYVYIYICIYVYIYIYTGTSVAAAAEIVLYIYMYVHMFLFIYHIYINAHICMHTHIIHIFIYHFYSHAHIVYTGKKRAEAWLTSVAAATLATPRQCCVNVTIYMLIYIYTHL